MKLELAENTLKVGSREYAVEALEFPDGDTFKPRIKLTGKRGAEYYLIPNQRNPNMMFALGKAAARFGWFQYKDRRIIPA